MSLAGLVLVVLIGLVFGWPWALGVFVALLGVSAVAQ